MSADKFLPKNVSWFRLPDYVKDLLSRVTSLEEAPDPTPIDLRPYRVYSAWINQTSSNEPTFEVLENTFNNSVSITRSSVGFLEVTSDEMINSKVVVNNINISAEGLSTTEVPFDIIEIQGGGTNIKISLYTKDSDADNSFRIGTGNSSNPAIDGTLTNYSLFLEVRVYD